MYLKRIFLELKAPCPMSAISETYNRGHNILELADFCQIFISQQNKGNVIITNKNGKYELTDVLPKIARLKKISMEL